jgi:hypothetical protein
VGAEARTRGAGGGSQLGRGHIDGGLVLVAPGSVERWLVGLGDGPVHHPR